MSQGDEVTYFSFLTVVLETISQILLRCGYFLQLDPKNYFDQLFDDSDHKPKPKTFKNTNQDLYCTQNNSRVFARLNALEEFAIDDLRKTWDQYNSMQLSTLIQRFSEFLSHRITKHCYFIYMKLSDMESSDSRKMSSLADSFKCAAIDVQDELASIRNECDGQQSIYELWKSDALSYKPNLNKLVRSLLLLSPHNMIVEQGFSKMKTTESLYANRMSSDLYDACRLIRDFFDRDDFEKFDPDLDLIKMVQCAGTEYKAESQSKATTAKDMEAEALNVRLEIGIFKRKTTKEISSQLKRIDQELEEAESNVTSLMKKKRRLQKEQRAVVERHHDNSSSIIEKWFKK